MDDAIKNIENKLKKDDNEPLEVILVNPSDVIKQQAFEVTFNKELSKYESDVKRAQQTNLKIKGLNQIFMMPKVERLQKKDIIDVENTDSLSEVQIQSCFLELENDVYISCFEKFSSRGTITKLTQHQIKQIIDIASQSKERLTVSQLSRFQNEEFVKQKHYEASSIIDMKIPSANEQLQQSFQILCNQQQFLKYFGLMLIRDQPVQKTVNTLIKLKQLCIWLSNQIDTILKCARK